MSGKSDPIARFGDTYSRAGADVYAAVQREVFGGDTYVNGYTTVAQADLLAGRLGLGPGLRLLDIGAGLGWPSLYLAEKTGCQAVLTDVPAPGLRQALARSRRRRLARRCAFARASGTHLPFRHASFDAVVHTDAL